MSDTQPDQAVPQDTAGAAAPLGVGAALHDARMQLGLSVDEVSNRIKFAPRQIEALEADDFAHLPEAAFVRGFVRSYARMLQLDPAPLLAALPHEEAQAVLQEDAQAAAEVPYPDIYTERKYNIIWLAAALGVAVLLGLFAWLLGGKPKEQHAAQQQTQGTSVETLVLPPAVPVSAVPDVESAAPPNNAAPEKVKPAVPQPAVKTEQDKPRAANQVGDKPVEQTMAVEARKAPQTLPASAVQPLKAVPATDKKPQASSEPAAAIKKTQAMPLSASAVQPAKTQGQSPAKPVGSGPIRVTFDADSWVEIKDADGKVVMSQLGHGGMEQSTGGKPPFTVTVGYASGVKLYYKGKQVDLAPHARSEVAHLTLE